MPIEKLAGFNTYWNETGNGVRRALLIHCFLGHSGAWRGVRGELEGKLKMRAFDMPGHGRSQDWDQRKNFQDMAVEMAVALIDKRADIIGHSFGATVALRLARDFPEKVRSVTLIEPVFYVAAKAAPEYGEHMQEMQGFNAAMKAGAYETAAREFDLVWGGGTPWNDLPAPLREALVTRIPLVTASVEVAIDDINRQVVPGALEAIKQPVLLMEGTKSPSIIRATQEVLVHRIPDVRRVIVAGAGHMVPISHSAAVSGEIAAFLKI